MNNNNDNIHHKTVYLIRHAESVVNERHKSLKRSFGSLSRFSLPTERDLYSGFKVYEAIVESDSQLSDAGKDQIYRASKLLNDDNFIEQRGIELIVHSPLQRAVETCKGVLGCCAASATTIKEKEEEEASYNDSDDHDVLTPTRKISLPKSTTTSTTASLEQDKKHNELSSSPSSSTAITSSCIGAKQQRVVQLDELIEKSPSEWIPGNSKSFYDRIEAFENWLKDQPETNIAVVGHSQFFKAMLGLDYKFGNVDVYSVNFSFSSSSKNETTDYSNDNEKNGNNESSCRQEENDENDSNGSLRNGWKSLKQLYSIDNDAKYEENYFI